MKCCYCEREIKPDEPILMPFEEVSDIAACRECAIAKGREIDLMWRAVRDLSEGQTWQGGRNSPRHLRRTLLRRRGKTEN